MPDTEYLALHARPWIRFIARVIDVYLFSLVVGVSAGLFFPAMLDYSNLIIGLLILFLWIFIETVLLSTIGTTPGKFLLNIQVRDLAGNKPRLSKAFIRSFGVWSVGLAFGLPIIYLITLFFSYKTLMNNGATYWDKNNFTVTHGKLGYIRTVIAALIITLGVAGIIWDLVNVYFPGNRYTPAYYNTMVENINKDLPHMLNSETELSKMSFEDNTLIYNYRLVNEDFSTIDAAEFYDEQHAQLLEAACDKSSTAPILGKILARGTNLGFDYSDKNSMPITRIVIKPEDCKKAD